ncbi:MAG: preprotein translocase subunit SecG [Lentisphaerae bacterium]|nr:preprotein translocase subunit SecG [Lentisphaerota bacterium]
MPVLTVLLYVAIFIVALLLIVLILIQPSKSGGMGAAFGGIGESVFGGKAGSHLTKTTVIMTAIFFVIALTLAAVIGLNRGDDGVSKALANAESVQPAAAKGEAAPAAKTPADK